MKVIDNRERTLAEQAKAELKTGIRAFQDMFSKVREERDELKQRTLKFRLASPVVNEFNYYLGSTLAYHMELEAHREFSHKAIHEFNNVDEIILDVFGEPQLTATLIELELSKEEYQSFKSEANSLGLSTTDFAQALIYTKLKKLNDPKRAERAAYYESEKAKEPIQVNNVQLPKHIFQKLKNDYATEVPAELKHMEHLIHPHNKWIVQALEEYYMK